MPQLAKPPLARPGAEIAIAYMLQGLYFGRISDYGSQQAFKSTTKHVKADTDVVWQAIASLVHATQKVSGPSTATTTTRHTAQAREQIVRQYT